MAFLIRWLQQFVTRNVTGTHTIKASCEIILAAGAPHSPQVLQLSGIGPKSLLSSLGIKTLVDLPGVGYNFHDQPSMFMSFNCETHHPSLFFLILGTQF